MTDISLAAMERLLKRAGAARAGEDAKEELRQYLEERGLEVAERAIELARHADRRTIKAADIRLATR